MKHYLDHSYRYNEYLALIDTLLVEGKTTGIDQSDAMTYYAKLNRQRMRRLANTVELSEEGRSAANSTTRKMIWLIITEGWCGDAAQNIPIIEKIAAASENIETRYLLRDENLGLMDQFLSSDARSIPKLIALDASTLEVLGTWGSRPVAAQSLFRQLKFEGVEKPVIMEEIQRWYNRDGGKSLQKEIQHLVSAWNAVTTLALAAA